MKTGVPPSVLLLWVVLVLGFAAAMNDAQIENVQAANTKSVREGLALQEGALERAREMDRETVERLRATYDKNGKLEEFKTKVRERLQTVRIQEIEDRDGVVQRTMRITSEEGKEYLVRTQLRIKDSDEEGDFMKVVRSDGEEVRVRIDPEQARERALERLQAADAKIELVEETDKNISRVVYNLETNKHGRFLGIFQTALRVRTKIDPETGDILEYKKPWWAFLVRGEEEYDPEAKPEGETEVEEEIETIVCTEEAKVCSDGTTYVSRNPDLNCEFDSCPEEIEVYDYKTCVDKTGISTDGIPSECTYEGKTYAEGIITEEERKMICEESGGEWKTLPTPCSESCEEEREGSVVCAQVETEGCTCPEGQCRNPSGSCELI